MVLEQMWKTLGLFLEKTAGHRKLSLISHPIIEGLKDKSAKGNVNDEGQISKGFMGK